MSESPRYPKRLIEVDLPIKEISAHARREKSIRHGHISTLHIWWARRPLAACRAVICAALWPDPADDLCPPAFREASARVLGEFAKKAQNDKTVMELCQPHWSRWSRTTSEALDPADPARWPQIRQGLLDFIADFANWDASTVPAFLETARALTQAAHEALGGAPGTRPLVVDPFAGGGSIPLEALRVGADAFASDLNPVPVLLNKVMLEYIPKYGQRLADEVREWGEWIKQEAEKELAEFYPTDPDGATPIAYLWARTIISEAPGEEQAPIEVPLLSSMWLAKKGERNQALRWIRDTNGKVRTTVVERTYADGLRLQVRQPMVEIFSPSHPREVQIGTSRGGSATCPVTGFTTPVENVRRQLDKRSGGASDARLICVVTIKSGMTGRCYRLPTKNDIESVRVASAEFERQKQASEAPQGFVPDGQLNHLRGFFNVVLYGMKRWGDLFAPRQALALVTLSRLVRDVRPKLVAASGNDFATAMQTFLAIAVDRQADSLSSLTRWQPSRETNSNTFGRQALPMVWDYVEPVPISGSAGSLANAIDWIVTVIEANRCLAGKGQAQQASATAHPLPDDIADALITDPPYYSAVAAHHEA
jgi:adenine-specific DNA methylase